MDISLPIPPITNHLVPNLPSGMSRSSAGDSSHSSHSSRESVSEESSSLNSDDWVFEFGDMEPDVLFEEVC